MACLSELELEQLVTIRICYFTDNIALVVVLCVKKKFIGYSPPSPTHTNHLDPFSWMADSLHCMPPEVSESELRIEWAREEDAERGRERGGGKKERKEGLYQVGPI